MAAIKETSKKLDGPNGSETDKTRFKLLLIRAVFVAFWLFFSSIIFTIAVLQDINWMRPQLEATVGQSIHRNVKLGHLIWHIGLRGFSVQTSRLAIAEASGDPFLMAGNCEIGFSLWPLIVGIGQIDHVEMQNPLFMAIRKDTQSWNFDDLLVASPDIDSIECHNGHVFVVDRHDTSKGPRFQDTELNNVEIKLHRGGQFTPAQVGLSFNLSKPTSDSIPTSSISPPVPHEMPWTEYAKLSFTGAMWGNEQQWWQKRCHFKLDCSRFSWQNWQTFLAVISSGKQSSSSPDIVTNTIWQKYKNNNWPSWTQGASLNGRFDLNASAEGVPRDKLVVELKTTTNGLSFSQPKQRSINMPEIISSAKMELQTNSINLRKFNVNIPDYKALLNGDGFWQEADNKQEARNQISLIGLLGDLDKWNGLARLKDLNGKLFFDLRSSNSDNEHNYSVELKATYLKISGLAELIATVKQPSKNSASVDTNFTNPFTQKYWKELGLSNQAKFTGTVVIKSGQGLAFKDCLLEDNQQTWKISGDTDENNRWHELIISNQDLQLAQFSKQLERSPFYSGLLRKSLGLNSDCKLTLDGKAKVTLTLSNLNETEPGKQNEVTCETIFNDASLTFSDPSVSIHHLTGMYTSAPDKLTLSNIHCSTGSGIIELNANVPANSHDPMNYHLHAQKINPVDLTGVLALFHLDTKNLNSWQLSGTLKDADLILAGRAGKPAISVTAIPDDLIFFLPDLKQPIHATSGKIVYTNDTLSLEKVGLSSQNSNCFMTMIIRNLSGASVVDKFSLVTADADLANLRPYFYAGETPAYFRNMAANLAKKYQISNVTGKISGIIEYSTAHGTQDLHGSIDITNGALACGEKKLAFRGINGTLSLSGNDLALRDLNGNVDDTTLSVDGRLSNYQDLSPQWNGDINAQVTPGHLSDAVSLLIPNANQKSPVKMSSKQPITIRLKSHGHNNAEFNSLVMIAEADAGLSISAANLNLHQPAGKKLTITGNYFKDDQKAGWRNLSFDFGGSSILFQGMIHKATNAASKIISKKGQTTSKNKNDANQSGSTVDYSVQMPDYMPALLLGQIFPNSIMDGATTGGIKGNLSVQGPLNSPQLSGKIHMSDLSLPAIYLNHASGELTIQPQAQSGNRPTLSSALRMRQFDLGQCQLSHGAGTLSWEGDPGDSVLSIFSSTTSSGSEAHFILKDFASEISDGTFSTNCKFKPDQNKSKIEITVKGADLSQLWPQMTNSQIIVTGLLDCHFSLESSGANQTEIEKNMSGSGDIHVGSGSFSRTGPLNARLNQVNLLHQGIVGFNVNNLLQSVVPAKLSYFNSIDGTFGLDSEILTIRRLLYDGRDLRFSAAGKANLALHSLEMDVAGVMSRVSTSPLGGPLGELSREITVQKLLDSLTLHKLDRLPSLPLLGGISNKSDLFTCKILAPYNQPKLISQSIDKSFHWLNYHSSVSAKHATAN